MFTKMFIMMAAALAVSPQHRHKAFLSTVPDEEVMGPNMNFTPVSTTMQCTISLTLQYMTVFIALAIVRTYIDLFGGMKEDGKTKKVHADFVVHKALLDASNTVAFAPMVCLMFVAFRMRVLQLSKGTDNPQDWVRYAMQFVAYSILANTLFVAIIPHFTAYKYEDASQSDTKLSSVDSKSTIATILTVIRYIVFLGLYVGFGMVCTGVFLYEPPAGTWEGEIPALSPAVACTVTLATAFFLVKFLQAASCTYTQFTDGEKNEKFEKAMDKAAHTMDMAPMLCAMFLAARMRALQMDPVNGNPQSWAQNCFYTCTYAITFQTILAVAVPYVLSGAPAKLEKENEIEALPDKYEIEGDAEGASFTAKALTVCRWIIMFSVYFAAIAIVCSVFTLEHPNGAEHTPPLSPTMHCVLNLAFQFFFIYFVLWVYYTMAELGGYKNENHPWMKAAHDAIHSAKSTVQYAPMLSVLFIATRMRALQITDNKGAPQGWVQDGMYLASWSILIQFLMCLILPFFTKGNQVYTPDAMDGTKGSKVEDVCENSVLAYVVTFLRYTALISLIGGVATVITGVFLMTPETANGRGAIPLVSDGTLPVDLAPQPPAVTDLPGAETAIETTGETVGAGVDVTHNATDVVTSPVANATEAATETVTG